MQEQLVSFDTAILARLKGFEVPCSNYYNTDAVGSKNDDQLRTAAPINHNFKRLDWNTVSVPTQGLLQKWLREKHHVYVTPIPSYTDNTDNKKYFFEIAIGKRIIFMYDKYSYFDTYEESLECGLQGALKLI